MKENLPEKEVSPRAKEHGTDDNHCSPCGCGEKPDYLKRYKHPANPIITASGVEGQFDSAHVDSPKVLLHGDKAYMFYIGYDGQRTRIGRAESSDMVHWENRQLVLDIGPDGAWDGGAVCPSYVFQDEDGRFVMTYLGFPRSGHEQGPGSIGFATSDDLLHWHRYEGNPILEPDPSLQWEAGGLYSSCVVRHAGQYHLFYNAKNVGDPSLTSYEGTDLAWPEWIEQIHLASGPDLTQLTRHPDNPVLRVGPPGTPDHRYVADPWVMHIEGQWHMFHFGSARDDSFEVPFVYEERLAVSDDLVHWTKSPYSPIIPRGPEAYDCRAAHKPSVIFREGIYYHYYNGVERTAAGPDRVICLATSRPLKGGGKD
jgi:predicted GH43/DUF377 family glycosyl hydrolase